MKNLQPICIIAAAATAAVAIVYPFAQRDWWAAPLEKPAATSTAPLVPSVADGTVEAEVANKVEVAKLETDEAAKSETSEVAKLDSGEPAKPDISAPAASEATQSAKPERAAPPAEEAALPPAEEAVAETAPGKRDLSYLAYYAYSEVPPDIKPADTVEAALKDVPMGTPKDEITLAAEAFGLDVTFMKAVAKIESDFDPKQRTGSYIGLFQLSHYEFDKYGSGEITNPRDNAIAAAYKFATAALLFEIETHKKATRDDLYLIHQQGTQGAAEHVAHPERIAWKSMCATDEGHDKGEKWCKRAIWQNTLPSIKQVWKSVDNLTSGAFVAMWQQRIAMFYSRYSEALTAK